MKRFFSQLLIALALLCGVIFIASVFVACLSNNKDVVVTSYIMSWLSAFLCFAFGALGYDIAD